MQFGNVQKGTSFLGHTENAFSLRWNSVTAFTKDVAVTANSSVASLVSRIAFCHYI
jgi:hypothetical protein